jgi:aldehyde:ferredoxin oxidoreductase
MKRIFAEQLHAGPAVLARLGRKSRAGNIRVYAKRISGNSKGGFALANKGPSMMKLVDILWIWLRIRFRHFEDKLRVHFFTRFRTWFSLHGLCKLPGKISSRR